DFAVVASEIGVDSVALQTCIDSKKYAEKVDKQHKGGLAAGVSGTPGNIIINQKGDAWLIPGALLFEQLKTTIDEALQN
ncbi:DsbA family protein, partial [Patescibacteria group bacterium]|nr:DsbA family protein [Patescibacteria group bacterium]